MKEVLVRKSIKTYIATALTFIALASISWFLLKSPSVPNGVFIDRTGNALVRFEPSGDKLTMHECNIRRRGDESPLTFQITARNQPLPTWAPQNSSRTWKSLDAMMMPDRFRSVIAFTTDGHWVALSIGGRMLEFRAPSSEEMQVFQGRCPNII